MAHLRAAGRSGCTAVVNGGELRFELGHRGPAPPGYCATTRFTSNSGSRLDGLIPEPYAPFAQRAFAALSKQTANTTEADVAEGVWRAATDESGQLRFPAGADAVALASAPR